MDADEALDLLYALADGAARWDALRSPGEPVGRIHADHRRIVREAAEALVRCGWDDVPDPSSIPTSVPAGQ